MLIIVSNDEGDFRHFSQWISIESSDRDEVIAIENHEGYAIDVVDSGEVTHLFVRELGMFRKISPINRARRELTMERDELVGVACTNGPKTQLRARRNVNVRRQVFRVTPCNEASTQHRTSLNVDAGKYVVVAHVGPP